MGKKPTHGLTDKPREWSSDQERCGVECARFISEILGDITGENLSQLEKLKLLALRSSNPNWWEQELISRGIRFVPLREIPQGVWDEIAPEGPSLRDAFDWHRVSASKEQQVNLLVARYNATRVSDVVQKRFNYLYQQVDSRSKEESCYTPTNYELQIAQKQPEAVLNLAWHWVASKVRQQEASTTTASKTIDKKKALTRAMARALIKAADGNITKAAQLYDCSRQHMSKMSKPRRRSK